MSLSPQGVAMSSIIKSSKKSCRILVDNQQQAAQKYQHFRTLPRTQPGVPATDFGAGKPVLSR